MLFCIAFQANPDSYMQAVADMVQAERTTLPIDFMDVQAFDEDVADAILQEYYRYEYAYQASLATLSQLGNFTRWLTREPDIHCAKETF